MDYGNTADLMVQMSCLEVDFLCCYSEAVPEISDSRIKRHIENFRLDHKEHLEVFLSEISRFAQSSEAQINQPGTGALIAVQRGIGQRRTILVLLENERFISRIYESLINVLPAALRAQVEENYEDELDHIELLEEFAAQSRRVA
ncbi:MAG: hypothetical protein GX556_19400 [Fibrobacter sp.]|nr:hypothetical protein [Fibrobacter sp.]